MADLNPAPAPAPENPPPAPAPVNTPPPAAVTVLEGERTERETNLEAELATEREARRKAETDAAYAQDEARRLKAVGLTPTPAPKKQKSMWNDFFGEED